MASLITSGNKMAKDILRLKNTFEYNDNDALSCYWKTYDRDVLYGLLQADRYAMIKEKNKHLLPNLFGNEKLKKCYFITIRPDSKKINFIEFQTLVMNFLGRECFNHFIMVFEQKGTDENTLGHGFHTHIIGNMMQRSKGEVLRDTKSTFKCCTAENCIKVDIIKTQKDMDKLLGYIRDHKAKDGHKKITEESDKIWRQKNNLQDIYTECIDLPPISSTNRGQLSIIELLNN